MRTATGLFLIALGAILAFAVQGHPSWLNIQVVGWVVMLTGVAGMAIPRRGYGWLRRRMVLRRGPGGRPVVDRVEEKRYPPYIMLNPGTGMTAEDCGPAASESPARVDQLDRTATVAPMNAGTQEAAEWAAAEQVVAEWESAE